LGHHQEQKHHHHRVANPAHLVDQKVAIKVVQQLAGLQLLLARGFLAAPLDLGSAGNQQMRKPIVQLLGHTKRI
jgi:hypothetical protein